MNNSGNSGIALLNSLPPIKRSRGFRLYGIDGSRYLDMYLLQGRAILGHRPGGIGLAMKQLISTGTLGEYPSVYHHRLERHLLSLFPGFSTFCVFPSLSEGLRTLGLDPRPYTPLFTEIPVDVKSGKMKLRFRFPFLTEDDSTTDVLIPLMPFPQLNAPQIFCFREEVNMEQLISPLHLAAIQQSLIMLMRKEQDDTEPWWTEQEIPGFKGIGPYLFPQIPEHLYESLWRKALKEGILLSPVYGFPSILPGEYDPGEMKPLFMLMEEYLGRE